MTTSNCIVPTLKTRQTYIFRKHWLVSYNQNLAKLEKSTNVTVSSDKKKKQKTKIRLLNSPRLYRQFWYSKKGGGDIKFRVEGKVYKKLNNNCHKKF